MRSLVLYFVLCLFPALVATSRGLAAGNGEAPFSMEEVVVTATKTARLPEEVPTNVAVVTEEEMRRTMATDVTDFLREIPGLTLNSIGSDRSRFAAGFRGINPNQRGVLLTMDGFEMNAPHNFIEVLNLPVTGIEKIEVVKMPSSVLFGPAGVGGVVEVVTAKPTTPFEGELSFLAESLDRYEPSLHLGGLLENGVTYRLDYRHLASGGFRENSFLRGRRVSPRLGYVGGRVAVDLLVNVLDYENGTPGGLPLDQYKESPEKALQKETEGDALLTTVGAKLDFSLSDASLLRLKGSFRDKDARMEDFGILVDYDTLDAWTAEADYQLDGTVLGMDNTLLAGLEYRRLDTDFIMRPDDTWSPLIPLLKRPENTEDIWGIFVQEEIRPMKKLWLDAGLRLDIIATEYVDKEAPATAFASTHRQWSPRLGFSYRQSPHLDIFGNYTRGIRSVTLAATAIELNEGLVPEKEESFELGLRGGWGKILDYSVAAFLVRSRDRIVATGTIFTAVNAGESEAKGVEATVKLALPHGFSTDLSYTRQNDTFTDFSLEGISYAGKRVPLVPADQTSLTLAWDSRELGSFFGTVRYVGGKFIDNDNAFKLDPYTIVDLKHALRRDDLEISVGIDNLFDTVYAELGVPDGGFYSQGPVAFPADGRIFSATLRRRF